MTPRVVVHNRGSTYLGPNRRLRGEDTGKGINFDVPDNLDITFYPHTNNSFIIQVFNPQDELDQLSKFQRNEVFNITKFVSGICLLIERDANNWTKPNIHTVKEMSLNHLELKSEEVGRKMQFPTNKIGGAGENRGKYMEDSEVGKGCYVIHSQVFRVFLINLLI